MGACVLEEKEQNIKGSEGLLALVVRPKHITMNDLLGARGFWSWQEESVCVLGSLF